MQSNTVPPHVKRLHEDAKVAVKIIFVSKHLMSNNFTNVLNNTDFTYFRFRYLDAHHAVHSNNTHTFVPLVFEDAVHMNPFPWDTKYTLGSLSHFVVEYRKF